LSARQHVPYCVCMQCLHENMLVPPPPGNTILLCFRAERTLQATPPFFKAIYGLDDACEEMPAIQQLHYARCMQQRVAKTRRLGACIMAIAVLQYGPCARHGVFIHSIPAVLGAGAFFNFCSSQHHAWSLWLHSGFDNCTTVKRPGHLSHVSRVL
jgi:hypothetical protein